MLTAAPLSGINKFNGIKTDCFDSRELLQYLCVETGNKTVLTDMYKSTRRFNAEPRLAVVVVIQLVNELKLYRYLQPSNQSNKQSVTVSIDIVPLP